MLARDHDGIYREDQCSDDLSRVHCSDRLSLTPFGLAFLCRCHIVPYIQHTYTHILYHSDNQVKFKMIPLFSPASFSAFEYRVVWRLRVLEVHSRPPFLGLGGLLAATAEVGAYTTWLLDAQMFRALNETRPSNCPSVLYIFLLRSTWPNHKHYTRQTRSAMRSILWIALIFAQYGRPFIILREQAKKTRSHGIEAIKV